MIKTKIIWTKPDYKNRFGRVSNKRAEKLAIEQSDSGDIMTRKEQYGRKIEYFIYRLERTGIMIEGLDNLSRERAIQELKVLSNRKSKNARTKHKWIT